MSWPMFRRHNPAVTSFTFQNLLQRPKSIGSFTNYMHGNNSTVIGHTSTPHDIILLGQQCKRRINGIIQTILPSFLTQNLRQFWNSLTGKIRE
mmetsp:Transcript_11959/g.24337  ORF Transcript_11959/g.24337 Transcript_11959/m.24337 type:complete len:93 (+) Transcript_11959:167-445(+)